MQKEIVKTDRAPQAIGPYSQAVKFNGMIFLSGQIPLDPTTGQMVEGDIKALTTRVMENIKGLLEASGSSFERVIKTTIFLADMDDFAQVNEIYGSYFQADPPARSTIAALKLPRNARIEIEMIAF